MNYRTFFSYLAAVAIILIIIFLPYLRFSSEEKPDESIIRVLSYSSFLNEFGAGPELAKKFLEETGLKIHWINAGNAGLLIERLKFKGENDQPDIVIGFDQFSIKEAQRHFLWESLRGIFKNIEDSLLPSSAVYSEFLPYDWGPMTFIYRKGEIEPPKTLSDLLLDRYKGKIILQDPRMSSPGFQFLLWILMEMGEEKGFEFLESLRPSIKVMSSSWSSSYSIFKVEKPSMVFSYFTSPLFHKIEEGSNEYQAVMLEQRHPIQVEYLGIPKNCHNCEGAKKLAKFLMEVAAQKVLMRKNFMLPVRAKALQGSEFEVPSGVKFLEPNESTTMIKRKRELINKWKKVFY